jgi:hypothetical protein
MTETMFGCIVAGAALAVFVPLILRHYLRERERRDSLMHLHELHARFFDSAN